MLSLIEEIQTRLPFDCFTDVELSNLITGSPHRRYGLLKRAIGDRKILPLRRGLYYLAERYRRRPLNLFSVAQKIYPPSYISFETALSHHGWIPEAVHSITSASSRRSREFATPLGRFRYHRIPFRPFLSAVSNEAADSGSYFMARPWKALADYVTLYKKDWRGLHPLIHSLRVEEETLQETSLEELEEILEAAKSRRVVRFFKGVKKDLKL